ncbi:MAG: leucine--tRNA ligase [Terrimicrobiaceae bacterium]|nr:leucine--tRNA ligase [Terrimicrobiaceae bacterium]
MSQRKPFPFPEFESRWQKEWLASGAFRAPNPGEPAFDAAKPKYYVLDMFPYPSGDGLHVGHVEGYTATDILARARRMQGFNVLHPMGWDAFGLPAEQFAIKTGQHPRVTTARNVARFRAQLQGIGFSYDWSREISTTDPGYFKWTQWIFLQLYGSWFNPATNRAEPIATYAGNDPNSVRLAYVAEMPVNWCQALGTVLANEEIVEGRSEVGGFPVERRPMRQWMLRITDYAQRLIDELDGLDWPESIKLLQRNWIGRSEGALVTFAMADGDCVIEVFTTRPDTLFGATYMVLAPEHPLVPQITTAEKSASVAAYQAKVSSKSDLERTDLAKEKSGVFTGAFAVNPVNGARIPVWIADYVLMGYGTGAIMAVPAHDERDFEFAQTFALPVVQVVQPPGEAHWQGFTGDGIAVNSDFLDGLPTPEAKRRIIAWLEERGVGAGRVNYKLRDWLFSRQRYWGEPFPILWENGFHRALDEAELPLAQPEMDDFKPTGTGEPPLAKAVDWVRYSDGARRETNTMPQWAGSCWYYLRFCDPENPGRFAGQDAERYWMSGNPKSTGGVDLYVGGTEHAVLHLLYARFWHKVLFDLGYLSTPEPFQRLVNQGIILGDDGHKMSKSRGNVVSPDEVISEYGADSLRLYEMFMGPLEQMKPWSMKGVEGVFRFLARVWRLAFEENQEGQWIPSPALAEAEFTGQQARVVHATIKKVTEDLEALSFNTAIAQMMIFVNEFTGAPVRPLGALRTLLTLLSPFAPHLCEEMWVRLGAAFAGFDGLASRQPWPGYDEALLIDNEVEIALQVNGKLRDRVMVAKNATQAECEALALANPKVREAIEGKTVVKVIVVPGKLVNVVVK